MMNYGFVSLLTQSGLPRSLHSGPVNKSCLLVGPQLGQIGKNRLEIQPVFNKYAHLILKKEQITPISTIVATP